MDSPQGRDQLGTHAVTSRKEPTVTGNPRETRVLSAVVSLVDSLLDDFDVVDLSTELTERCAELLDVAAAGFLLADPLQKLHLLAATSEKAHDLELFQLQADEGPCLDCFASGRPISVADLGAASTRWPRFVSAAVDAGFASVHAVPMRAAGIVLGALGLFGTELRRARRRRSAGCPKPGAHRVCGDFAGTRSGSVCGRATPAHRTGRPRRGRAGQGFPARAAGCAGGGRVYVVASLRAVLRRSSD